MNLMYIPMDKIKEDNFCVWYKIEIKEKTDEIKLNEKGKKDPVWKTLFGVFKFKKELFKGESSEFKLDNYINFVEEETDPSLLSRKKDILIRCYVIMNRHLKEGFFPDKTCLATG